MTPRTRWLAAVALLVASVASAQPAPDLRDVGRAGDGTAWVVVAGRLLRSVDQGRAWQDVTPPGASGAPGLHAHFSSAAEAWVATWGDGDRGTAAARVHRTLDGGRRGRGGARAVALVRLVSSSNFSYGHLFRTDDGGGTWEALPPPPVAGDVWLQADGTIWLAGGPSGGGVFESRDGGRSWSSHGEAIGALAGDGDALVSTPATGERGDALLTVAVTREGHAESVIVGRDAASAPWRVRARRRVVREPRPARAAAADDELSRAVRDLLAGVPRATALVGRALPLTTDVVADRVVVAESGEAWILARWGRCGEAKRACEQGGRLFVTADGGETLRDVTPAVGAAVGGGPTASAPRDVALSQNKGFDKCTAARPADLQVWWQESPYRDVNVYIGGISRACSQPQLSPAWVQEVFAQGWRLIPTWVGYQAPCTSCTTCRHRFSRDAAEAEAEGVREADRAGDTAASLGLGARTVIYVDLEAYNSTDLECRAAASAFVSGWSRRMRERGHVAGVYGSATNASQDWTHVAHRPDAVWIAKWDLRETVWGLTPLSDAEWSDRQRIHQYRGGHDEVWGGITFNIDNDIEDGPVAAPDGAALPDAAGPDLVVARPRSGETIQAASVVVEGTVTDAGRGDAGVAEVIVNGVPADGGRAGGRDVAAWRREVPLAPGANVITVVARDASDARNATTVSFEVLAEGAGPPAPPAPPPPEDGPRVLAGGLSDPRGMAIDGGEVWWIDGAGRLGRVGVDGDGPALVLEGLVAPSAIVLDGPDAFVADARGIWRVPRSPDAAESAQLVVGAESPAGALVVAGDTLFWTEAARGLVLRATRRGDDVRVVADGATGAVSLALSAGGLFWVERPSGLLRAVGADGGDALRLASGATAPALVVSDTHVYFASEPSEDAPGRLLRVGRGGGDAEVLVEGAGRPWAVDVEGPALWWADATMGGAIWRARVDGSAAERVASALAEPSAVDARDGHVFWIERAGGVEGAGRIVRAPVPAASQP